MKKKKHIFTVLLLAISLLSASISVYAQGNGNADNENNTNEESFEEADRNLMKDLLPGDLDLVELSNKELEDYEIPEVISAKDIKEKEHANRLFAQETDDYSFTAMSIMRGKHSDINDTITLYDKLSLKKKWG